jgi:hypothetical protein
VEAWAEEATAVEGVAAWVRADRGADTEAAIISLKCSSS